MTRLLALLALSPAGACRFIAYCGNKTIDARRLLLYGENNLLALATSRPLLPALSLSRHYDEAQVPLRNAEMNLDGYGVSWYEANEAFPRRVRSSNPIIKDNVSDATFRSLLDGRAVPMLFRESLDSCVEEAQQRTNVALRSRAVFAHVRAASPNSEQKETNSHPFAFQTLTWLHNGHVAAQTALWKEKLMASLPERVLRLVSGDTDSELAGAVFASHLAGFPYRKTYNLVALRAAMLTTVADLRERSLRVHETEGVANCSATLPPSSLNFAVSDGTSLVVIRFRSSMSEDPPTLYYKQLDYGVIVASEPSSSDISTLQEWTLLGKNRMLSYSPGSGVHVECVCPQSCDPDVRADAHFNGPDAAPLPPQNWFGRQAAALSVYNYQNAPGIYRGLQAVGLVGLVAAGNGGSGQPAPKRECPGNGVKGPDGECPSVSADAAERLERRIEELEALLRRDPASVDRLSLADNLRVAFTCALAAVLAFAKMRRRPGAAGGAQAAQ